MSRFAWSGSVIVALVLGTQAMAQQAKAPASVKPVAAAPSTQPPLPTVAQAPPPVGTDPAATSATYGDWVLRCQRVGDGDKAQRICEVAETIKLQNQQNPIAEIAIGRIPGDKTLHLTVVLPPSVSFPSTVEFASAEKPPRSVDLPWRRCLPGGCFAEMLPTDDTMKMLRAQSDPGRLTFKDAAGRDVALPISFRGLTQALDALDKA